MKTTDNPYIFIVEDDLMYREMLKMELENKHYDRIEVFSSGTEFLQNMYKMPDIILLDYNLEDGTDTLFLLKKIRTMYPDVQVIVMSAQESGNVAEQSLKYGAFDYIIKNDYIFKKIDQLIDKICQWNKMLLSNKKLSKMRTDIVVGSGLIIAALFLLNAILIS